ncbi:hypothetical protein Ancab_021547, partial [Ancistrocladus abbreviatus]
TGRGVEFLRDGRWSGDGIPDWKINMKSIKLLVATLLLPVFARIVGDFPTSTAPSSIFFG